MAHIHQHVENLIWPLPSDVEIGVIGGTGIYGLDSLINVCTYDIETPYGKPSCAVRVGTTVEGVKVAFIARHDIGHRLTPSEIPYRANIYALKLLGVKYLLTFAACGSLREECKPTDIVIVDQFIDRTFKRESTFFGGGMVAHVEFGDPTCPKLSALVKQSIESLKLENVVIHSTGTYVCMEGPAFSTRAESNMYRQFGASVIGMTALTEAKLAREAEISYALVALVTDYDCWRPHTENVTVSMVKNTLKTNGDHSQAITQELIKRLAQNKFESHAHSALKYSLVTDPSYVGSELRKKLLPIIGKYLPEK